MSRSFSLEKEIFIKRNVSEVFKVWLDPSWICQWISPDALKTPLVTNDPIEGGEYRMEVLRPEGEVVITGEYKTIIHEELLVFSWKCSSFYNSETLVTVNFTAVSGGTQIQLKHENLLNEEEKKSHSMGWEVCCDQIKKLTEGKENETNSD